MKAFILLLVILATGALSIPRDVSSQRAPGPLSDRVEIAIGERLPDSASAPILTLGLRSEHQLPCVNIEIDAKVEPGESRLTVTVQGLVDTDLCLTMTGPATFSRDLALPVGTYDVSLRHRGRRDRYRLLVDTLRARIQPIRTSVTFADTTTLWRTARNTLIATCGHGLDRTQGLCLDYFGWIQSQPGVSPYPYPTTGRSPISSYQGESDVRVAVFHYEIDSIAQHVLSCTASLQPVVAEAVGVGLAVQTWNGRTAQASSRRSYHEPHIDVPHQGLATAACAS